VYGQLSDAAGALEQRSNTDEGTDSKAVLGEGYAVDVHCLHANEEAGVTLASIEGECKFAYPLYRLLTTKK
jgi:hypothetical protein